MPLDILPEPIKTISSSPSKRSQYFEKTSLKSGLGRASSSKINAPPALEQAMNLHRQRKLAKTPNWPGAI